MNIEALDRNEIALLIELVGDRIKQSDDQGIPREHSSSVFRERLIDKLLAVKKEAS